MCPFVFLPEARFARCFGNISPCTLRLITQDDTEQACTIGAVEPVKMQLAISIIVVICPKATSCLENT
jgi:hypothetical protein